MNGHDVAKELIVYHQIGHFNHLKGAGYKKKVLDVWVLPEAVRDFTLL